MEANGVVLRQPIGFPSSSCSKESKNSIFVGRMGAKREVLLSGFCDQGHLKYYNYNSNSNSCVIMSEKKDDQIKKKKKQLKLLKGLRKDLSMFSQMGFGSGLDLDPGHGLVDQVKGNMILEAAELLLEQLQRLKAEEKELKKKTKDEKKRLKAANTCKMSSSSSSESSDSECGEVVDMKSLKNARKNQNSLQQVVEEASSSYPAPIIPILPPAVSSQPEEMKESASNLAATNCSKKIEVCMGGKCKKSGAATLLDEFQRVVGIEGAVSGCKCMGKCRDGPNIKVLNELDDNGSVRVATNSLCIGVGLEDVNMIVANFLGENSNQLGFAAAS